MCGRFTLRATPQAVADLFDLPEAPPLEPRYNIAPTQPILAVRENPETGKREVTFFNWGLIPAWADDPSIGSRMINARAETVVEKPSFRAAFKYRRCIVPADGFYEWQKIKGGKQPHLIGMADGAPFGFAGLWEHWERDGSVIESCTLLTTDANELVAPIHNRMPVILQPEDYEEWLARSIQTADLLRHLLRPFPAEKMAAFPVSTVVNNPRNEDPACVVPWSGNDEG
ncbi:MAG: SOS response-associated peptidase [Caldilineaceae bacterium]|nr:SOS response-associated peptidase [Caldilineaceae bacterium]